MEHFLTISHSKAIAIYMNMPSCDLLDKGGDIVGDIVGDIGGDIVGDPERSATSHHDEGSLKNLLTEVERHALELSTTQSVRLPRA